MQLLQLRQKHLQKKQLVEMTVKVCLETLETLTWEIGEVMMISLKNVIAASLTRASAEKGAKMARPAALAASKLQRSVCQVSRTLQVLAFHSNLNCFRLKDYT